MNNPNYDRIGIDLKALKNQMEGQLVCAMMKLNPDVTKQQLDQIRASMTVFEKHGIGALEALDILREIGAIYHE
jgi:hypothetical protein